MGVNGKIRQAKKSREYLASFGLLENILRQGTYKRQPRLRWSPKHGKN